MTKEIRLVVSDKTFDLFNTEYQQFCDIMEIEDQDLPTFLVDILEDHFEPKNPEIDQKRKDRIIEIVRKNPGITPKQVHEKLVGIEEREGL
jgi:hypothetical protein